MLLAGIHITPAAGCIRGKVIGKFLKNGQRSCGVKVEHIRIFFAEPFAVLTVHPRVLCPKCRLHIEGGTFHITEHQDRSPLRDSNARGQLADRQSDSAVMVCNSFPYLIKGFLRFITVIQLTIAGSHNDFILREHRVFFQLYSKCLGTVYTVQQPEGMLQFTPQLIRGERKFSLCGKCIKELIDTLVMNELTVLGFKELVKVESVFLGLTVDFDAPANLVFHDFGHLICIQIQARQTGIGIVALCVIPIPFRRLFLRIGPVENGSIGELIVRQRLERRAGQMQRKFPLDLVKRGVRL